jgi:hypothetical protein
MSGRGWPTDESVAREHERAIVEDFEREIKGLFD